MGSAWTSPIRNSWFWLDRRAAEVDHPAYGRRAGSDRRNEIGGYVVNDVPPKDRDIAMVFQNYALYPHMTVAENMSFTAPAGSKAEINRRVGVAPTLSIGDLLGRRRRFPAVSASASPWGRRLCATRRSFSSTNRCPTSTPSWCKYAPSKRVHQQVKTTTLYVTHDQVVMTLADRVVVMNAGRIEQVGAPNDLYHAPRTRFVAGFIGSPAMNFIPCRLEAAGEAIFAVLSADYRFEIPPTGVRAAPIAGATWSSAFVPNITSGPKAPPHALRLRPCSTWSSRWAWNHGVLQYRPVEVSARVAPAAAGDAGQRMPLMADLRHMHLIDPESDDVL